MRRIFVNEDHFIEKAEFYEGKESEFEKLIKNNLAAALKLHDSKVLNFKLAMISDTGGGVAADLILINGDYSDFIVIEVETLGHSLNKHVLPQIRKLKHCNYSRYRDDIYKHLVKVNKNHNLDKSSVLKMLRVVIPKIYVISNKYSYEWDKKLSELDSVMFYSMTPYKNEENIPCLYVREGEKKEKFETYIASWKYHYFEVIDKSHSLLKTNTNTNIYYLNKNYNFLIEKSENGYFLHPAGQETIENSIPKIKLAKIKNIKYKEDKYCLE